jgi:transposase
LRLFASANVVSRAEEVMQRIVETYNLPNRDFHKPEDRRRQQDADLLRAFSEACREDLRV